MIDLKQTAGYRLIEHEERQKAINERIREKRKKREQAHMLRMMEDQERQAREDRERQAREEQERVKQIMGEREGQIQADEDDGTDDSGNLQDALAINLQDDVGEPDTDSQEEFTYSPEYVKGFAESLESISDQEDALSLGR